jgi:hypothetical protein
MLAKEQLKLIAQEIDRTAGERIHGCEDAYDRQQLWEVVRHASRVVEAVAELERDGMTPTERLRRVRYIEGELELALESARSAKVVTEWAQRDLH